MTPERHIERLTEISRKKLELLNGMLDLTRQQSQALEDNDVELLENLVTRKQVIIDEVILLDDEFDVCFKSLKKALNVETFDELAGKEITGVRELQNVVGQLVSIMHQISHMEKKNNEGAATLLKSFGDEIKKLNQGKKAALAYRPAITDTPSYFIDRKK